MMRSMFNIRNIIAIVSVLLLSISLWYFRSIVVYIIIAAVLSLIGHPIVVSLGKIKIKNFRLPRALNAIVALVLIWTILIVALRVFIPLIANEADELSKIDVKAAFANLDEPIQNIENTFWKMHILDENSMSFKDYLNSKVKSILNVSLLSNIFNTVAGLIGDIFIAFFAISFIAFFFLKDDRLFVDGIVLFSPSKYEKQIRHILSSIKRLLVRYFVGICIQVTVIMTLVTTGLTVVGLEFNHALVIGLFAGLMNVIPYVGPLIGSLFGMVIGMALNIQLDFYTELLPLMGYIALVFGTVQVIDNIVFQPIIFSSSVKAHPLEIFLVIMMSASLAGIAGMVLAIPGYTILRVIAKEFFNQFRIVKKLTEKI